MAALLSLSFSPARSKSQPFRSSTATEQDKRKKEPSFHLLLEGCTSMTEVKQIHAQMIRSGLSTDPLEASRLVAACAGRDIAAFQYARLLFGEISRPTTYTFNSIIRGYTNQNLLTEALAFYVELIEIGHVPDKFTFPSLFKSSRGLEDGKQLHCHAIKLGFASDPYVQNTLMNMYSTCGCLLSSFLVFDKMSEKTVVSWATMIAAYTKWGRSAEALSLYRRMEREEVKPNTVTLLNVLTACASARDLENAETVVENVKSNGIGFCTVLSAALMDVYCKCGKVSLARNLFDEMSEKNLVCWNIMIKGHVEDSNYREALNLFGEMQFRGIKADKVTMASLILACAYLCALELGKWLHAYIKRECIEIDVVLGTAMVDMYAKCGSVDNAMKLFDEMPRRDVMTWTALIGGLAMCGHGEKALQVFDEMRRKGVKPDCVTFVGVLTACSHAGLVEEGRAHFDSMPTLYDIQPTVEHYGCMVDLFGRAGDLEKAVELVRTMPIPPDNFVFGGLLGACRIHGNLIVAESTTRRLLELHPGHGGTYVLLSNIYSSMGKWNEAEGVRELMEERNVRKPPGCSMVEIDGVVHEFFVGDETHPQSPEIYAMVEDMIGRIGAAGYVTDRSEVLLCMEEEEKENALSRHSEKLAIAFGLISTRPGTTIRVTKNLRICGDCHEAAKFVSAVYAREIIIRDRCRFHHFKNGSCSCNDFW